MFKNKVEVVYRFLGERYVLIVRDYTPALLMQGFWITIPDNGDPPELCLDFVGVDECYFIPAHKIDHMKLLNNQD